MAKVKKKDEGTRLAKGTRLADLWGLLPEGAEEALLEESPDGKKGRREVEVDGVGKVAVWLDACSEGEDRGGYVRFYEIQRLCGPDGKPLVLEADTDGSSLLFEGRMEILY